MPFLATPVERYRHTPLEAAREFAAERCAPAVATAREDDLDRLHADFGIFVRNLLDRADPANVASGRVPETFFWLLDGEEYIGRVSIRHPLNDQPRRVGGHIGYDIRPSRRRQGYGTEILRLALPEAARLGLRRTLLTCDADNVGSKRIIAGNGGELEETIMVEGSGVAKHRYWIDLD